MKPRIAYADGQLLDRDIFTGAQSYLRAEQERHRTANHEPGVVLGLDLQIRNGKGLRVNPGVGIDSSGCLLVLVTPLEKHLGPGDEGCAVCLKQESHGDEERWRDCIELQLVKPDPEATSRAADLCLGTIGPSHSGSLRATTKGRQISGARSANWLHPGEVTRLLMQDAARDPAALRINKDLHSLLELTQARGLRVRGTLRVGPGGRLDTSLLKFQSPQGPTSTPATPWSISIRPGGSKPKEGMKGPLAGLCVLENAKQASGRLRVGLRDSNGKFQTLLLVDAGGSIHVPGNLTLEGDLQESPVEADPTDSRFVALLRSAWGAPKGDALSPPGSEG